MVWIGLASGSVLVAHGALAEEPILSHGFDRPKHGRLHDLGVFKLALCVQAATWARSGAELTNACE